MNSKEDRPSDRKKKYGGKIDLHGYIPAEMYDELYLHRSPDDGDRWESSLLRRIVREWLAFKKPRSGPGAQESSYPVEVIDQTPAKRTELPELPQPGQKRQGPRSKEK